MQPAPEPGDLEAFLKETEAAMPVEYMADTAPKSVYVPERTAVVCVSLYFIFKRRDWL